MPLNTVQVRFVNETARKFGEDLLRGITFAEDFVAAYDALQAGSDALSITTTTLDDAGDAPRGDAPAISGEFIKDIADLARAISTATTPEQKQKLIQTAVRSLPSILRA